MNLKNLILVSGLAALATACEDKISYDVVNIENETYVCRKTISEDIALRTIREIDLLTGQGKILSNYSFKSETMRLYGPTEPLAYFQAAELMEECIRKFATAEKETK